MGLTPEPADEKQSAHIMKKLCLSLLITGISSAICFAGPNTVSKLGKDKTVVPAEDLFRANEFDVSLFAAVGVGRVDHYDTTSNVRIAPKIITGILPAGAAITTVTTRHYVDSAWGGGIEADYFFTRYFGLGAEGAFLDGHDAISKATGYLIGRYPLEHGTWAWAPYAMIGGGGQFDGVNAGSFDLGGGAELRFPCKWGVFTDARWVYGGADINYALIRLGVRCSF